MNLNDVDSTTIDNIDFAYSGAVSGRSINLTNACDVVTIKNCNIVNKSIAIAAFYTGPGPNYVLINPADAGIAYNMEASRWEVKFGVTGFSGFFVTGNHTAGAGVTVSPVPATTTLLVTNTNASLNGSTAVVVDVAGREVYRFVLDATSSIDLRGWAPGVYNLRLADGSVVKVVRR